MCVITEGLAARRLRSSARPSGRRRSSANWSTGSARRPARPLEYHEQNWTTERYSGGGMISHAPTGVLTEFGYTLREPCGRIHWAGTESSTMMCGWIDGAIRSGERAANEAMAAETTAAVP